MGRVPPDSSDDFRPLNRLRPLTLLNLDTKNFYPNFKIDFEREEWNFESLTVRDSSTLLDSYLNR